MTELMISSDSHVIEPHDLWQTRLPEKYKSVAPTYPKRTVFQAHDGGADPKKRVHEMAVDGVSTEVLYPSLALPQYSIKDPGLQEACFRVYNDWLLEYCSHVPDRLFGLGLISCYDINKALEETKRCAKEGMKGVMVWQVPPDELAFTTSHYDPFWALCEEMELPVSLHILTGMPYGLERVASTSMPQRISWAANMKLFYVIDSLWMIMAGGVFDRFPKLKVVLCETEVSWLPYALSQWDRYVAKGKHIHGGMKMDPTEYFKRNVHATFFNDPPTSMLFGAGWGVDNCMWSNDFPHGNSTWPKSREVIQRDLGHLSAEARAKLMWKNCVELYKLPVLEPVKA